MLERLSGHRDRPPRAPRVDRRLARGASGDDRRRYRRRPRADAGALPGRDGLRRARRRARSSTRSTARASRPSAHADVVDRPLAPLEDADPVPGAALPRGDLRRARQRPLGPPGRARGLPRGGVRRRRARRAWTRPRRSARARRRSSRGAERSLHLAAEHPERVDGAGVHRAGPAAAAGDPARRRRCRTSTSRATTYDGWAKWNRHYWLEHYEEFLEFFFSQCFTEPHSTKQREDCVGWGLETDARDAGRDAARAAAAGRGRACASCSPRSTARCS